MEDPQPHGAPPTSLPLRATSATSLASPTALYERNGIERPTDAQRFDIHRNPRGHTARRASCWCGHAQPFEQGV